MRYFALQDGGESTGQDPEGPAANKTGVPNPSYKEETRVRKKVTRTPLKIGGAGFEFPGLDQDALKVCARQVLMPSLLRYCLSFQFCARKEHSNFGSGSAD